MALSQRRATMPAMTTIEQLPPPDRSERDGDLLWWDVASSDGTTSSVCVYEANGEVPSLGTGWVLSIWRDGDVHEAGAVYDEQRMALRDAFFRWNALRQE